MQVIARTLNGIRLNSLGLLYFRELRIKELLKKRKNSLPAANDDVDDDDDLPDMEFDKGLKIPGKIWHKLYK